MFVDAFSARKFHGRLKIGIVGTGVAGLSAAWLLAKNHDVVVFESEARPGGHSHTVDTPGLASPTPVDTGFIVYTESTYPNLTALFKHLKTPTKPSEMSFAVSLDNGALEYSGTDFSGLFAQKANLLKPRFWSMLRDLTRFYRCAPADAAHFGMLSLGEYLNANGYGEAFRQDHLYPMAAAIWSLPAKSVADYPVAAFVDFCQNHGLLRISGRPSWRTVEGGSRTYVNQLCASLAGKLRFGAPVVSVARRDGRVFVTPRYGEAEGFDHVVIGAHADQALAMLDNPWPAERRLLGAFPYSRNDSVLHQDASLMPKRRKVWSSWNYMADRAALSAPLSVTYWMNRLQAIPESAPLFVTLNPHVEPRADLILDRQMREHPIFNAAAIAAQSELWSLQGGGGVWFCGSYFGAGFHEDALQSGLGVAEQLGGEARPWTLANPSNRIKLTPLAPNPQRIHEVA